MDVLEADIKTKDDQAEEEAYDKLLEYVISYAASARMSDLRSRTMKEKKWLEARVDRRNLSSYR